MITNKNVDSIVPSPGLMFETIEGGFLDIDVRIVGPDGKVIYQVNSTFSSKILANFNSVMEKLLGRQRNEWKIYIRCL